MKLLKSEKFMDINLVIYQSPSGLFMIHSPDLPGLHIIERTMLDAWVGLLMWVPILQCERLAK